MGKLTDSQKDELRKYLVSQGLTFKPLLDEMADHMSCEMEERMDEGRSFRESFSDVTTEISDNHFQQIQKQVMDTINKRFTLARAFSFLALGFLIISTLFKIMHLQYAGEVLLLAFAFLAVSLLTASLTGISRNREKKGAAVVVAITLGIVALLIGYGFKIMHLAGADNIILGAVCVLVASTLVNTVYVFQFATGKGNLLTFLHEKYTPGIERFFFFLLLPLVVYKISTILMTSEGLPGNMALLVIIFGSGLQFIALCWRTTEKDLSKRDTMTLAATMISCVCLLLPFLGPLVPIDVRMVIIMLFNVVAGWLAYRMEHEPKRFVWLLVVLGQVVFIGWGLIRFGTIPASFHSFFFNLPILVILTTGLLFTRKEGTLRAYMVIVLSSYLFEYMM